MKRITKVLGTSIVAAALSLSVQANLLTDPGFESGAPSQPNPIPIPGGVGGGWAVFNGASFSAAAAETGSWGIQETEGIGQAWNFEAPYQVTTAGAGGVYTLTADFMTPTGITSSGYVPAVIQLTFFNAAGADIGTVETGGVGAKANQYNPTGLWQTASVTATAPVGAAYVGSYLAFMEFGNQTQADTLYWDNANLVPEPSTLALLALGIPAFLLRRKIA
jgi:hypothetical protein